MTFDEGLVKEATEKEEVEVVAGTESKECYWCRFCCCCCGFFCVVVEASVLSEVFLVMSALAAAAVATVSTLFAWTVPLLLGVDAVVITASVLLSPSTADTFFG